MTVSQYPGRALRLLALVLLALVMIARVGPLCETAAYASEAPAASMNGCLDAPGSHSGKKVQLAACGTACVALPGNLASDASNLSCPNIAFWANKPVNRAGLVLGPAPPPPRPA